MPKSETHENSEFQLRGFNHLALVCKDMQETVKFYEEILGFRLVKTLEYPDGGQHFFLDMGNGIDGIAFFWFPDPPPDAPGIARSAAMQGGSAMSAVASMNHVAFDVAPELIEEYRAKLKSKGIRVTSVVNHADSLNGKHQPVFDPNDTFVRSIYFSDPNGIQLEFAAWTHVFTADDVAHAPKTEADLVPHEEKPVEAVAGGD